MADLSLWHRDQSKYHQPQTYGLTPVHAGRVYHFFFLFLKTPNILWVMLMAMLTCTAGGGPDVEYQLLREKMVTRQIAARGVTDERVLTVMRTVERHDFVPVNVRHDAYGDYPLPIGEGQTISQPYIVALMTEAVKPDSMMKVLEVGTGSGYQAAILSHLCNHVYTIEINQKLGQRAQQLLASYPNISVRIGDGYQGWKEHAPFDAIIVTCAPTHIPAPLVEQLAEGGRMIIPYGEAGWQELELLEKRQGVIVKKDIIPVRFVPMIDHDGKSY